MKHKIFAVSVPILKVLKIFPLATVTVSCFGSKKIARFKLPRGVNIIAHHSKCKQIQTCDSSHVWVIIPHKACIIFSTDIAI